MTHPSLSQNPTLSNRGVFGTCGFSVTACVVFAAAAVQLTSSFAMAGDTAYDAMRSACASPKAGRDSLGRVLKVAGTGGRPHPSVWHITLEDAGGRVQEIDVQRDRIVGIRRGGGVVQGTRLNLAAIQLDSDGVFTVANGEALRANVSFDRLDYSLSTIVPGGAPTWVVELFDGPNRRVGSLRIAADSGTVLDRSSELTLTEEDKREARWSKSGEPYRSMPDFFHRTWKSTEKTGYKLKKFFLGDEE